MPGGNGFGAGSKAVMRRQHDRNYAMHQRRMMGMQSTIDTSPPRRHPHLAYKLKDKQQEEEYLARVEYENKLLLHKMMRIMQTPRKSSEFWNDVEYKSLNEPHRSRASKRIEEENLAIARRLEGVKPVYSVNRWDEDFKRHENNKALLMDQEYNSPRGRAPSKQSKQSKPDEQYDDDFESEGEEDRKKDKLPEIKQEKGKSEKQKKSDSEKLPKIQEKKHDPDLYMYWGKYFNNDPDDGYVPRDADEDTKAENQATLEAKQLFRVAKGLDPPTDVFIRTLIKRTPAQREATRQKFNELYDLDLPSELKKGLGRPWYVLIDGLLPEGDEGGDGDKKDDRKGGKKDKGKSGGGGAHEALYSAIQKEDAPGAVKVICENEKNLSDVKEAYRKDHGKSPETQVVLHIEKPEQLLVMGLLKDRADDGKNASEVEDDAKDIHEAGDGRWSNPSSTFLKLVETRPYAHTRAVLKKYQQVSGGTTAVKAVEKECSKKYANAMSAFLNMKGKGGAEDGGGEAGGSNEPADTAVKMYKNMNAENPAFVNLLVERAEIDMPAVRKAYKKKYKTELNEDLQERSRHPTVPCLLQLVMKKASGSDEDQSGKQKGGKGDAKKEAKKKKDDAQAAADAEKLHKAMDGMGTDEDTILEVIIKKSNAQRQTLKKKYKEKYKKDLEADLKSELSGDLEEVIIGLLMPPAQYDAHCLNQAVKGAGTNEDVLVGILCTANPKELKSVKEKYNKAYGESLDDALKGDTSGGFADLLLALAAGKRDQGTTVNEKEAKEDAEKIFKGKKGKLDLENATFKALMTTKNKEQVNATFAEYKKLSGKTMEAAIREASSGDARDGYLGLLGAQNDVVTFYADSLQKAFKGFGTNDEQLIRIIVSRAEVDLPAIKAKFLERHKRSLKEAVKDETSGDYRKALIMIIDK